MALFLLLSESTTTALIVGFCSIAASLVASLITRRGQREIVGEVVELKRNTDGMTTQLLSLTERAGRAEGAREGAAEEREHALVVEPDQVAKALSTEDVREQINQIEAGVAHTQEVLAEEPVVRPALRKQIDAIQAAVNGDSKA